MDLKQCTISELILCKHLQLAIYWTPSPTIINIVIVLSISLQVFVSQFMFQYKQLITLHDLRVLHYSGIVVITINTLQYEIISFIPLPFVAITTHFLVLTDSRLDLMRMQVLLSIGVFQSDSVSTSH